MGGEVSVGGRNRTQGALRSQTAAAEPMPSATIEPISCEFGFCSEYADFQAGRAGIDREKAAPKSAVTFEKGGAPTREVELRCGSSTDSHSSKSVAPPRAGGRPRDRSVRP